MPKKRKVYAPRTPAQEAIEHLAEEHFTFLVQKAGYTPGPIERTIYYTQWYYLGPRIGVRVEAQFNRDTAIVVDLIRTAAGQLMQEWSTLPVMQQRWRSSLLWLVGNLRGIEDASGVSQTHLDEVMRLYQQLDPEEPTTYDPLIVALGAMLASSLDFLAIQPYEALFPGMPQP